MQNLEKSNKSLKTLKTLLILFLIIALAIVGGYLLGNGREIRLLGVKDKGEKIKANLPSNLPDNGTMLNDYGIVTEAKLTQMLDRNSCLG